MPHPPILVSSMSSDGKYSIKQQHATGVITTSVISPVYGQFRRYHKEPESTSNPIRPNGTRAPAPYYAYTEFKSAPNIVLTQKVGSTWGWYTTGGTSVPYADELVPGHTVPSRSSMAYVNVDTIARTNFLNKLGKASGKDQVQLGVMAGEFRETVSMATGLAAGLVTGIRNIARSTSNAPARVTQVLGYASKHGRKETARWALRQRIANVPEKVIDAWLVTQFGLKPLYYDLVDSTAWLTSARTPSELDLPVTVRSGYEDYEDVWFAQQNMGVNSATYWLEALIRQTIAVHYSATYRVPAQTTWPEQLGIYNPFIVGHELVKFSWLFDYVSNTGEWLNSLYAAQNTHFIEGSRSIKRSSDYLRTRQVKHWEGGSMGPIQEDLNKLPLILHTSYFDRELISHGVMPALLPGVRNKLGLTRLANTLAALSKLRVFS